MRKDIEAKKVREVMTRNPITVDPGLTIQELKTKFETSTCSQWSTEAVSAVAS